MVANTPMDTDKIKIFGARVKADSFEAVHELEMAEKEKMKEKVGGCTSASEFLSEEPSAKAALAPPCLRRWRR